MRIENGKSPKEEPVKETPAENKKFWQDHGVISLLEEMREKVITKSSENEDYIPDPKISYVNDNQMVSIIFDYKTVVINEKPELIWSSVVAYKLGGKKVGIIGREDGKELPFKDYDISDPTEEDKMQQDITLRFSKYLV